MYYEYVIRSTKKLESVLAKRGAVGRGAVGRGAVGRGAVGRGLHEKVTSIESTLDESLVKQLCFLASVRNSLVHDEQSELTPEGLDEFKQVNTQVSNRLSEITLEQEMLQDLLSKKDALIQCPNCHKDTVPELIMKKGMPSKSFCTFCGELVSDFTSSTKPGLQNVLIMALSFIGKVTKILLYGILGIILISWLLT